MDKPEEPDFQSTINNLSLEAQQQLTLSRANCQKALNNLKLGQEADTDREAQHRFAKAEVSAQFASIGYLTVLSIQTEETKRLLNELLIELRRQNKSE